MRDKRNQERKGKESGREKEKERKAPNLFIKEKEVKQAMHLKKTNALTFK